jgi:hypothetical protein
MVFVPSFQDSDRSSGDCRWFARRFEEVHGVRPCPVALGPRSSGDQPNRGSNVDALGLNVIKGLTDQHRNYAISFSTEPRRRV